MANHTFLWAKPEPLTCQVCGVECDVLDLVTKAGRRYWRQERYCSDECYRQNASVLLRRSPTPIGSRRIGSGGYVMVYIGKDHPWVSMTSKGWVGEHRLVMAESLGYPLESHHTVHHKNGHRDDNRLENLELWDKGHPAGQRVDEKRHCETCSCIGPGQKA